MASSVAEGDANCRPFSPRAENFAALDRFGGTRMYEDGVIRADPEKRPEGPSEALEEAEKARLQVEAEMAARALLPAAPPRDFA